MKLSKTQILLVAAVVSMLATASYATIDGIQGPAFSLTAKTASISTPDGGSVFIWGLANQNGLAQYPAPTLIVQQGQTVSIDLTNNLPVPISLIFPGQENVVASALSGNTAQGILTLEANTSATVRYSFTARNLGTYVYHSGTNPNLQVNMGIVGAIIVYPPMMPGMHKHAYQSMDSMYDVEYLFLLTEMDSRINALVERGEFAKIDTSTFFPTYWFINGRCAPDTVAESGVPWFTAPAL